MLLGGFGEVHDRGFLGGGQQNLPDLMYGVYIIFKLYTSRYIGFAGGYTHTGSTLYNKTVYMGFSDSGDGSNMTWKEI